MSICVECAVQYHDLKEIPMPFYKTKGNPDGVNSPEALIDGKKHRLSHVALYHVPCEHCRRVSGALFVPRED
jgi:hypothetical protein